MPNPGQRRKISFFEGEPPKLNLNDDDIFKLIDIIRKSNRDNYQPQAEKTSIKELIKICNGYLELCTFEIKAVKTSEDRKCFEEKKKAATIAVQKLTELSVKPNATDGDKALNAKLLEQLWSNPIRIGAGTLVQHNKPKFIGDEGTYIWKKLSAEDNEKCFGIRLDAALLHNIARSIASALKNIEEELTKYEQSGSSPFNPGDAFRKWLLELKVWAKENGHKHGYSPNGTKPSHFAKFAFELHSLFPSDCKQKQMNSPGAMGDRIKSATADLKNGGK